MQASAYLTRSPRLSSPRSPGGTAAPVRPWKATLLHGPQEGISYFLDVPAEGPSTRGAPLCEGLFVTVAYTPEDQFAVLVCRLPGIIGPGEAL
ncbi:MAG: hypothetical protein KJ648_07460 [Candidatus Omnitrophica bacterium]|nr:hypothetical protein [Candidatus Omnitrophota bacterium]